jgi:hypothetical protein
MFISNDGSGFINPYPRDVTSPGPEQKRGVVRSEQLQPSQVITATTPKPADGKHLPPPPQAK